MAYTIVKPQTVETITGSLDDTVEGKIKPIPLDDRVYYSSNRFFAAHKLLAAACQYNIAMLDFPVEETENKYQKFRGYSDKKSLRILLRFRGKGVIKAFDKVKRRVKDGKIMQGFGRAKKRVAKGFEKFLVGRGGKGISYTASALTYPVYLPISFAVLKYSPEDKCYVIR